MNSEEILRLREFYQSLPGRVQAARTAFGRPLTAAEKVLFTHLHSEQALAPFQRGESYLNFQPDRAAMQDALAQMAMLQFFLTGRDRVAVPTSIHCDHLLRAKSGAVPDLAAARITHGEVYRFLQEVAHKYGIDFWEPGGGIIHQVILERYAYPGALIVGTDSHTPNAGGMGALAIGVGGADVVDVLTGMPWELRLPKIIGVKLTGKLSGWASAKDVILKVAGILTTSGGTDAVMEYFGPGAETISCTGKGTICNMGAEIGATTSIFGYDRHQGDYLRATNRAEVADLCDSAGADLTGDPAVYEEPEKYFDRLIEIDLSRLEPHVNGPYFPDLAYSVSEFGKEVIRKNYPAKLEVGLIGSCTNSSYEDLTRAASVVRAAKAKGLRFKSRFTVTPGSEQIWATAEREGLLDEFRELGATILASACGPCIGQWDRDNEQPDEPNSIMTSFNRNFARRNDGNSLTHAFVGSPELVTAMALSGSLLFNPLMDVIVNEFGENVRLPEPGGQALPEQGFIPRSTGFYPAAEEGADSTLNIDPKSERIQLLERFLPIPPEQFSGMRLLFKTRGKCTTGFISPAGEWLRFRGHLPNISQNTLLGATNAFSGEKGSAIHLDTGDYLKPAEVALRYRSARIGQVIVGGENYGEGSSREHAAMQPRWLGVHVIVAQSFARIHESNLKKQGILALVFVDPADYDLVRQDDYLDLEGISDLAPSLDVSLRLHHRDGTFDTVLLRHSYSKTEVEWFRAGAAVNLYRRALKNR